MVELTLPKNSKISTGKTWPKPEGATNLREYRIYRWSPDDGEPARRADERSTNGSVGGCSGASSCHRCRQFRQLYNIDERIS